MSQQPQVSLSRPRRRTFLKTGLAAAIVPRYVLGGRRFIPPSDRVNIAVIGTGGQGIVNIRNLFEHADAQVISISDVSADADYSRFYYGGRAGWQPALNVILSAYQKRERAGTAGKCSVYIDYREMLDEERAIDAVVVATPDHVHAVATIAAMQCGKHVYCEKPLTHSVGEARRVAEVARQTGVATQMGNQGHSGEGIRQTCEWIWAGAIGQISEVHAWTGAGGWAEGGRPTDTPPVPAGFHWDLWLGPAPWRPYHPAYAPYNWRGWWDFGTGAIGDMACHNLDPAFWALKLGHPTSVETLDTPAHPEVVPAESTVRYQFPAREGLPPVTVTWHDGRRRPEVPGGLTGPVMGNGILFVGEKGYILCPGWGGPPRLLPKELADSFQPPPPTLPRSRGHHRDWLDACKGGEQPSSNFEVAAHLTEVVLLGNIAQRVGRKIEWNGAEMRVVGDPEADALVDPPYRAGWVR